MRKKNPPPSSDIWKIKKGDYIQSKFPGATWETIYGKYYDSYRQYEHDWEREAKLAITYGLQTQEEAHERRFLGLTGGEKVRLLPPTLLHVTSAKDEVIRDGLKTREQLNVGHGRGLGGGTRDTVSLTASMAVAQPIFLGLLEGRQVARGELTIPKMAEIAKEGIGAEKPWLRAWFEYYSGTNGKGWKGEYPRELTYIMEGYKYEGSMPEYVEKMAKRHEDDPTPWEPVDRWPHGEGELYTRWRRRLTEEELVDKWFDAYKTWIVFREAAGGTVNPVFFLSDPLYLAQIKPSQIAILEFRSKPGTHGYYLPGEDEYRIWDGDVVEFERIVVSGE